MRVRSPAFAGTFYPSDPQRLRATVEQLLANASRDDAPAPKALIVPHAGISYSGPVAASAYVRLLPARHQIERVVLVGPSHREPIRGIGISTAEEFLTPLGGVTVDQEGMETVQEFPFIQPADRAHQFEHSLEVQLPFLQVALDKFQIIPLLVGMAKSEQVAEVLALLWGGPETLILVTSDLSHHHDHVTAARLDRRTAEVIESLQGQELTGRRACGFRPIQGLLDVARTRGLSVKAIDLRDSSQTAGDPARVVGYGAFVAA